MTKPLTGSALVTCAKANAIRGITDAATNCGYGQNTQQFQENLRVACEEMGVDIQDLSDLITAKQQAARDRGGVEISPDSFANL